MSEQTKPAGIGTLLVANRGEIARRVIRTCRRLGIRTVAVHSDADAEAPYVAEAEVAVRLPGSTPSETYLRGDLIIEAARRAGADAVHPGYGFLSENADFARRVLEAGLVWVGPAPDSIETMGDKLRAKEIVAAAGVPVLDNLDPDEAAESDLPLLVKASAGGGGRGMRIVRSLADLPDEVARAGAEAASAFGDGTVFVEPYVESARHIEVQVVGDPVAGVMHVLGERDCSLQRRHQKVIEETPAPGLTDAQRDALHSAARAAAESVDYVGAGTVEFLVDACDPGRFFFLEMNTRLQVEHPVTEAVFGLDLVAAQLDVAEGRAVERAEATAGPRGHAIQGRLYAEDPAADWQPQSGRLTAWEIGGGEAEEFASTRYGVRVDSGFEAGSEVSTHYDAMLAKVIAWAPSRAQAIRQLAGALRTASIHGLVTNRELLLASLTEPTFVAGEVSTDFFDRAEVWSRQTLDLPVVLFAAALHQELARARPVQAGIPLGWRNVVSQPQRSTFEVAGEEHTVAWFGGRVPRLADGGGRDVRLVEASAQRVVLEVDGVRVWSRWDRPCDTSVTATPLDLDTSAGPVTVTPVPRFIDPADAVGAGSLLAQMPGSVVEIAVAEGERVEAGQRILVLEAMKMQHTVTAPEAGTVVRIPVQPGAQVAAGDVLAVVEETP